MLPGSVVSKFSSDGTPEHTRLALNTPLEGVVRSHEHIHRGIRQSGEGTWAGSRAACLGTLAGSSAAAPIRLAAMRARAHPVRGTGGQHARGAVRVRTATRTSTCDASGTRCGRAPSTCNRHDNLCDVASHSFVRLSLPAHRYITPCPHESPPRMPPWRPSHHACSALTPALPAVPCLLTMQRAPHVCMPVDAHMFHALLYAHDRC